MMKAFSCAQEAVRATISTRKDPDDLQAARIERRRTSVIIPIPCRASSVVVSEPLKRLRGVLEARTGG